MSVRQGEEGGERETCQVGSQARVREWKQRKSEHAESPLAAAKLRRLNESKTLVMTSSSSRQRAVAMVNRVKVAETERPQMIMDRIYFPIEDCAVEFFEDSPKRWR